MNMDRRTYLKHTLALSGGLLIPAGVMSLVGRPGVTDSADFVGFDGRIMGTGYSVRFGATLNGVNAQHQLETQKSSTKNADSIEDKTLISLAQDVHSTLQTVDHRMSTWRDTSELSTFNNNQEQDWYKVSSAILDVIDRSMHVSKLSDGAFDVSVGPLVDLWGFGAGNNAHAAYSPSKPSDKSIKECLRIIGYEGIEIDRTKSAIRKLNPQVRLDFSGIAKGYAVDKVAELLDARGYENYLVDVGGELRSRGQRSNGLDWRVAIERPNSSLRDALRVVKLNNCAIATSGDYRNFYVKGGKKYSHSIDPRNGRPVNHELVSVSVIADTTMLADALSTALIILGPEEALSFAERHQVAAHFILKSVNENIKETVSAPFSAYMLANTT